MEIGGLRVVASPVRVHWGREGRSEVRVPDGGGEGVSTLTGQRSLQAGLNAHLSKPVEADALFSTLESLIQ